MKVDQHPYFHRARKDSCPEIAKVRCPDCGAKLHFDTSSIKRRSYAPGQVKPTPVNAIGGPATLTPRGVK